MAKRKNLKEITVTLHNDDFHNAETVVEVIQHVLKFSPQDAEHVVSVAGDKGSATLLITHYEKAELIQELFRHALPSLRITIS